MRGRSRLVGRSFLLFLGIGALVGCSTNEGDRVAVVGDSITSLDQPALRDDLGDRFDLTITGDFGATIAEAMPESRVVTAEDYDQVVINLGTNDVIGELPVRSSISTLGAMVDRFDRARCVHLVNINEHMVNQETGALLHDGATRFNDALEELAAGRDRVSVIDWNAVVEETLGDGDPPTSTLTKDSTHPTKQGNSRLNELYRSALDGCGQLLS